MGRLYLIRHGEIGSPQEKRFYGSTDLPLSEKGRQQARLLAQRLSSERVDMIFSSPLKRALETAGPIAVGHNLDLKVMPDLGEVNFGDWEGVRWDDIRRGDSDRWAADPWSIAPPAGETFAALHARVAAVLTEAGLGTTLVCHAGPIRAARMILTGASYDAVLAEAVPYATAIRFTRESV
jgi:broad specificity phosphatase PhoE